MGALADQCADGDGARAAVRLACAATTGRFYDGVVSTSTAREPGALMLAGVAVGTFICTVSFALFIHTISQLSSPIVAAAFIAAGIVLRQRATTPVAHTIAVTTIVSGVLAGVASIALAAAGISGAP
jgi:hypothetical protein